MKFGSNTKNNPRINVSWGFGIVIWFASDRFSKLFLIQSLPRKFYCSRGISPLLTLSLTKSQRQGIMCIAASGLSIPSSSKIWQTSEERSLSCFLMIWMKISSLGFDYLTSLLTALHNEKKIVFFG